MGSPEQCRRRQCADPTIAKGLCAPHWVRWYYGLDLLNVPGDEAPAPPQQVWSPPGETRLSGY